MKALFTALLNHHPRKLTPMKFVQQMTTQIQNFFEDIVLENELSSLVVECLPARPQRTIREKQRLAKVAQTSLQSYFLISTEDDLACHLEQSENFVPFSNAPNPPIFVPYSEEIKQGECLVIISDPHFSALLVSVSSDDAKGERSDTSEVLWTFDPDIVYTALQILLGRFFVEFPAHAIDFQRTMELCIPRTISLLMTLSVTTRLAQIWQKQTSLQLAINKIASATRQSLDLRQALQMAADEVARALKVENCIFHLEPERRAEQIDVIHNKQMADSEDDVLASDLNAYTRQFQSNPQPHIRDGTCGDESISTDLPTVVMPIVFWEKTIGVLFVQTQDLRRIWQDDEIALLQTVADQVAIAANHARLYIQSQQEALTDSLTGVFNRRFLEIQLDREFRSAERNKQPFSIMVVDIDHFKRVNDTYGHATGDNVIHHVAQVISRNVRALDTVARYGGEEFVVILPQAELKDALTLGERIRADIARENFSEVGGITVSVGAAAFPVHADKVSELFDIADKCLLQAKRNGRNCVIVPPSAHSDNHFGVNDDLPLVVAADYGKTSVADEAVEQKNFEQTLEEMFSTN